MLVNTLAGLNHMARSVNEARLMILWMLRKENLWRSISDQDFTEFILSTFEADMDNPNDVREFRYLIRIADSMLPLYQERLDIGDPIIARGEAITPEDMIRGRIDHMRRLLPRVSGSYDHQTTVLETAATSKVREIKAMIANAEPHEFNAQVDVRDGLYIVTMRLTPEEWYALRGSIPINLL